MSHRTCASWQKVTSAASRRWWFGAAGFASVLCCAAASLAAGTALDVQSGRSTGMAGAMTAHVDDASAIYFNPAGIAQGKGIDAQIGITGIIPGYTYTDSADQATNVKFDVVTPFNAYVSAGLTRDLSVGLGVFTPFGLRLAWPSGWEGRRQIISASNINFYFNPTVAYRFGRLRVGAGLQLVRSTVELKRAISFGDSEGSVELGGATWGIGVNAGLQLQLIPNYLDFGAHYRSAMKLDFDQGNAHFANVPPSLQSVLHDQRVTTSLTQPDSLALGLSGRPQPWLLVDADVVWFDWSKFRSIDLTFLDDHSESLNSSEPKNWRTVINTRVGAEAALNGHWRIRSGVLYDPSPSRRATLAPDVPDLSRINVAAGGTYQNQSGFHVDVGYQHLFLVSKTSANPIFAGEYSGAVNILGITVGYRSPPFEGPQDPPR